VIGAFREKRICRVRIVWSCRVHRFLTFSLTNVWRWRSGRFSQISLTPGFSQVMAPSVISLYWFRPTRSNARRY
jgi:hypothetical protein